MPPNGYCSYLPVSFFGASMGLSAIAFAWQNFAVLPDVWGSSIIGKALALFFAASSVLAFLCLFLAYALKILTHFKSAQAEWVSALTKPFFATFTIALLLLPFSLSILGAPPVLSLCVWLFGASLMMVLSLNIVQFWFKKKLELASITPGWMIPVVGLLDIPLALPLLENIPQWVVVNVTLFCLAVGLFWSVVLFTLIVARVVFFSKLPEKLTPTLVIFLAPFGAGVGANAVLSEALNTSNSLGGALFSVGVFLLLALLPQIKVAKECCPFRVTWWAISFPLAAMASAAVRVSGESLGIYCAVVFLMLVTLSILWLMARTLTAIFQGELKNIT